MVRTVAVDLVTVIYLIQKSVDSRYQSFQYKSVNTMGDVCGLNLKASMRNILFCLIWLFCLVSCNHNIGNELDTAPRPYSDKITLIPSDTLVISISSRSNVYSGYVKKCRINGNPYLGVVNENTNELEFYDLADAKGNFKISFQNDGPNGIGQLTAFEVVSDSTLLIGSTYRTRLYISDLSGNILKVLSSDKVQRKGKSHVPIYYTNQPLMYSKEKNDFYVFTRVDTDYNAPGIWSGTTFLKVPNDADRSGKHVFELPPHFDDYVHGAYFSHSSHLLIGDRYLVLGIPFYNNLLIYDLDKEELTEKSAGSKYFGDILPWSKPNNEHEEFYVSANSYRELAYDEERKILYRIAYRKMDYIGVDGLRRNWDNKLPSVIVFNEDFEKIGEVDLSVNTIYTRIYFTHKGKLYLSLNHPDNNPSEDIMVFVGFKPEKL